MKFFNCIILAIVILTYPIAVSAQNSEFKVKSDTNSILIGQQIKLNLSIKTQSENEVYWPQISDTIGEKLEVVSRSGIDTSTLDNGFKLYSQNINVTCFDTGIFEFPPLTLMIKKGNYTIESLSSELFNVRVNTIPVDTTIAIKDIKGPESIPYSLEEILPWIIGALLLLILIAAIIYFVRKYKKGKPLFSMPKKPALPPHIVALGAFESLRRKKLWQNGQIKEFHSELTDILRSYFESKFSFGAMEMTSDEIINECLKTDGLRAITDKAKTIMTLADLVKFAKQEPLPDEHDNSLKLAIEIVEQTTSFDEQKANIKDKDVK